MRLAAGLLQVVAYSEVNIWYSTIRQFLRERSESLARRLTGGDVMLQFGRREKQGWLIECVSLAGNSEVCEVM